MFVFFIIYHELGRESREMAYGIKRQKEGGHEIHIEGEDEIEKHNYIRRENAIDSDRAREERRRMKKDMGPEELVFYIMHRQSR